MLQPTEPPGQGTVTLVWNPQGLCAPSRGASRAIIFRESLGGGQALGGWAAPWVSEGAHPGVMECVGASLGNQRGEGRLFLLLPASVTWGFPNLGGGPG